jgi:hypothetical protein
MCFLRRARGFGWLDPRLNRSVPTPSLSHHAACSQKRRFSPTRRLYEPEGG